MSFDLMHIWQTMDVFARAVVTALVLMATASLAVFAERLWYFWRAGRQSERYGRLAQTSLIARDHAALVSAAETHGPSPLAALVAAGMKTYLAALATPGQKLSPVELARRELARKSEALGADVRRGFGVLASVGSVAPFVGLLGTVVGIIAAFENIAKEGSGGIGAVSAGIAEALVVTALGLVVAIPAVLAFNYLSGRADRIALALDQSRGELVDHLEATDGTVLEARPGASTPGTAAFAANGHARAKGAELGAS